MSSELLIGKEGIVMNYRRSRHIIHPRFCILKFPEINTRKDASRDLVGRTVAWKTETGRQIRGVITRPHGNSGAVRTHFKKGGLPGQALGTKIKIIK